MTKFTTPVSMVCTPEEFKRELRPTLEEFGYMITASENSVKLLTITCKAELDPFDLSYYPVCDIAYHADIPIKQYLGKIYYVSGYNPELFLALAAMTDEEYGIAGEWWVCDDPEWVGNDEFTKHALYKAIKPVSERGAFLSNNGVPSGYNPSNLEHFRKATREELIAHFTKEGTKTEERERKRTMKESINQAVQFCHNQAKEAGWHDIPRETGTCLMLIVSEIAEAMEGDRKNLMDDHLPHRKMFEVELADAAIRIFDLAGREGIDLGGAIEEKLAYNRNRADHKRENRQKEGGKKY